MVSALIVILFISLTITSLFHFIARSMEREGAFRLTEEQKRDKRENKNLSNPKAKTFWSQYSPFSRNFWVKRYFDDAKEEIAYTQKMLKRFPRSEKHLFRLAELYFEQKNYEGASNIYADLEQDALLTPTLIFSQLPHFLNYAVSLIYLERYEKARMLLMECVKTGVEESKVAFYLGKIAFLQKDYKTALHYLSFITDQSRYFEKRKRYWGLALYYVKKYPLAIPSLKEEYERGAGPEVTYALAHSLSMTHKEKFDLSDYLTPLLEDDEWSTRSAVLLGKVHVKREHFSSAIPVLSSGLKHSPNIDMQDESSIEVRYYLALSLIKEQNLKEGMELLFELHRNVPSYKDVSRRIEQYRDMLENPLFFEYCNATLQNLGVLFEKIITGIFPGALVTTDILNNDDMDKETVVLANLVTRKDDLNYIFIFLRDVNSILRAKTVSAVKSDSLFIGVIYEKIIFVTAGSCAGDVRTFIETRPVDIVERSTLLALLKT